MAKTPPAIADCVLWGFIFGACAGLIGAGLLGAGGPDDWGMSLVVAAALAIFVGFLGGGVGAIVGIVLQRGNVPQPPSRVETPVAPTGSHRSATPPEPQRSHPQPKPAGEDEPRRQRRFQFSLAGLLIVFLGTALLLGLGLWSVRSESAWGFLGVLILLDAGFGCWYGWCASKPNGTRPWPLFLTPVLAWASFLIYLVALFIPTTGIGDIVFLLIVVSGPAFVGSLLSLPFCALRFEWRE